MRVSRTGALAMLAITVLWAVTPAVACLLPTRPMTAEEHECCRKMAHQCGSSVMPSSHSCCQPNQGERAVGPVSTYPPTRSFAVAVVPQTAIVLINPTSVATHLAALEAPPPEASPGCSSILRI